VQSKSRFLPDSIRLELDAFGIPILPTHHGTSLLERQHVWQRLIQMDSVTRAIVMEKLSFSRTCWIITPSYLPNHKSWEVDELQVKLGHKMTTYYFQGASEACLPGHPLPTIVEPKGAVSKKEGQSFRDISDAHMGNSMIPKWVTLLSTTQDLASSRRWRATTS
jgi:hypothetical protein